MKVSDFSKEVALREGKKIELSIAQIKEVIKIVNELTDGKLYKIIRKTEIDYGI